MLGAGVMAAGQMDVDRRVERHARLAPARNFFGVALGVGGRELAAGIAGAGDEAGADGIGVDGETERFDLLGRCGKLFRRHAGDQQVLPDGEPQIAVAEFARDFGEAAHLRDRSCALPARQRRSSSALAAFAHESPICAVRRTPDAAPARRAPRGRACGRASPQGEPRIFRRPWRRARISAAPWCGRLRSP